MVAGIIDSAAEHGWHMRTGVVYENDEFEPLEDGFFRHVAVRPGKEKGKRIAAWATAVHRDGRRAQPIVLDEEAIEKRKAKARTKNIWNEWPDEMWKKSAAHRLYKELPLDPADQRVARVIQAGELEPGEAAEKLYGPREIAALTQGSAGGERVAGAPVDRALADGSQQAAPEGSPDDSTATSGAAPGPPPDEIPFGDDASAQPSPEEVDAATAAAGYVVNVTNKAAWVNGLTLAQVNADERGEVFFRWALSDQLRDGALKEAVVAYVRVRLPGLIEAGAQ